MARTLSEGTIVVLFADFGDRYLSTNLLARMAATHVKSRGGTTIVAPQGGTKTRVKLYLTYPSRLVREPLIYHLSRNFDLVFNIRQASVNEDIGIIAIELDGAEEAIERGIAWLRERGVTVEPIEKNVIE